MLASNESVNEEMVAKDVTILINRIGEYRANSKIKWIDFCNSFIQHPDDVREYRVNFSRFVKMLSYSKKFSFIVC